ncbi:hypothetical protein B5X24_HaOG202506 [Helicoverpa armigera]|uniref:Potassium channel domain-containing protein n=1 Tax=Helicoverpa armigera TaxID=29058 RepID=A0A2W1BSX0_HELAM|nr:hypothetical protein B5X24_HaOG202506 [Helicoverpa armigera]
MRLVVPGCVNDARSIPALRIFVLASAMALYLTMGASVFQAIEGPLEQSIGEKLEQLKAQFLQDHPCVTGSALSAHTAIPTHLTPR